MSRLYAIIDLTGQLFSSQLYSFTYKTYRQNQHRLLFKQH